MKFANKEFKSRYQRNIELSLVLSLVFLVAVFQGWKQFEHEANAVIPEFDKPIYAENIRTVYPKKIPKPSRPAIPVETDDPDVPIDATIEGNNNFITDIVPPPPPFNPEDGTVDHDPFISYDEPPTPVGGFMAIQRKVVYPEIARKAGVEGRVVVKCLIDERGNVIDTQILQSLGNNGCDEAAITAVRSVKWKAAMQRDKPVKVWISVPVTFRLK